MYICVNQKVFLYGVAFSPWEVDQMRNICIYNIINSLCNIILDYLFKYTHTRQFDFFRKKFIL